MFGFTTVSLATLMQEKAINGELRALVASQRAQLEWFAAHVNELKVERAALFHKIGLDVPVPTIELPPAAPLPGMDDNYIPTAGKQVANIGDQLARRREARDRRGPVAAPLANFSGFEDVGDAAARELGLTHDDVGNVLEVPVER
jgi:hypothetical protein